MKHFSSVGQHTFFSCGDLFFIEMTVTIRSLKLFRYSSDFIYSLNMKFKLSNVKLTLFQIFRRYDLKHKMNMQYVEFYLFSGECLTYT